MSKKPILAILLFSTALPALAQEWPQTLGVLPPKRPQTGGAAQAPRALTSQTLDLRFAQTMPLPPPHPLRVAPAQQETGKAPAAKPLPAPLAKPAAPIPAAKPQQEAKAEPAAQKAPDVKAQEQEEVKSVSLPSASEIRASDLKPRSRLPSAPEGSELDELQAEYVKTSKQLQGLLQEVGQTAGSCGFIGGRVASGVSEGAQKQEEQRKQIVDALEKSKKNMRDVAAEVVAEANAADINALRGSGQAVQRTSVSLSAAVTPPQRLLRDARQLADERNDEMEKPGNLRSVRYGLSTDNPTCKQASAAFERMRTLSHQMPKQMYKLEQALENRRKALLVWSQDTEKALVANSGDITAASERRRKPENEEAGVGARSLSNTAQ